ncbi:MAG: hypothetical protein IKR22_07000, partial [Clostridiales bacterium]|nr:hypothetical protein [Clostridiales bacterium]
MKSKRIPGSTLLLLIFVSVGGVSDVLEGLSEDTDLSFSTFAQLKDPSIEMHMIISNKCFRIRLILSPDQKNGVN